PRQRRRRLRLPASRRGHPPWPARATDGFWPTAPCCHAPAPRPVSRRGPGPPPPLQCGPGPGPTPPSLPRRPRTRSATPPAGAAPACLAGAFFGRETQIGQATDRGLGGEAALFRGLLHLRARVASLGARGGPLRGVVGQLFRVAGQRADEARGLGGPLAGAT